MESQAKQLRDFKQLLDEGVITKTEFENKKIEILGEIEPKKKNKKIKSKNLFGWYAEVIKKYADFNGRARRSEYWSFILMSYMIAFLISWFESLLFDNYYYEYSIFSFLYLLFIIIPSLAVLVRRMHDTNNSGWILFLVLVPIIGPIFLFVLLLTDGTEGENTYGDDPKGR